MLPDISRFLGSGANHKIIGLQIAALLIQEFNIPRGSMSSLSKHRKVAVGFRDSSLLPLFTTCLELLKSLNGMEVSSVQQKLVECTLHVLKSGLSFDFIGTMPDESSEDICTIQLPATWKGMVCTASTLELFFSGIRTPCSLYVCFC